MEVNINKEDEKYTITIDGRIDTANASEFEKSVHPLLGENGITVYVDCAKMSYISSSGLRVFMMMLKNMMATGSSLILQNMTPEIKDIFDMTGFSNIFTIE